MSWYVQADSNHTGVYSAHCLRIRSDLQSVKTLLYKNIQFVISFLHFNFFVHHAIGCNSHRHSSLWIDGWPACSTTLSAQYSSDPLTPPELITCSELYILYIECCEFYWADYQFQAAMVWMAQLELDFLGDFPAPPVCLCHSKTTAIY